MAQIEASKCYNRLCSKSLLYRVILNQRLKWTKHYETLMALRSLTAMKPLLGVISLCKDKIISVQILQMAHEDLRHSGGAFIPICLKAVQNRVLRLIGSYFWYMQILKKCIQIYKFIGFEIVSVKFSKIRYTKMFGADCLLYNQRVHRPPFKSSARSRVSNGMTNISPSQIIFVKNMNF